MVRTLSENGLQFLKDAEGFIDHYYEDQIDQETIGYGHCATWRGRIRFEPPITHQQGEIILKEDLVVFEQCVNRVAPNLNQFQFDACVNFAFNMSCRTFSNSDILRHIRHGNMRAAVDAFPQYNSMDGQYMEGLAVRRMGEKAMFVRR
ncbi:unnamed protein product [Medioppia subpectinata]|uniref:Lysozyme n=1 Tax=Medioppia subpectinata TaxID=1979941 RepID=A0A7R9KMC6_9ACAR|nr:unnamed protein product [Medioppia subpectinata]CAG2105905.1 unnamed protein product [Medioppia subpectinata]